MYCYKVMSFGLKNAGTTYQQLVNKVFVDKIGQTMEVYVDDMLVKSLTIEQHIDDLASKFASLSLNNMRLNLKKCTFGVKARKFLCHMVSHIGIEANLEKIQAILDMPSLKSIKDKQRFVDRMAALN